MECHLCLKDRNLLESHVIPEFLYRPGYDEKHRMEVLEQAAPKPRLIQKGLREKLLCADCENLFANTYEDYFARLWYRQGLLPARSNDTNWDLTNLDYTLFKLFHLSILWRAGISTLEPFAQVSLGHIGEHLRVMLLDQDAGPMNDFQIVGVLLLFPDSNHVLDGLISSPMFQVRDAHPLYMFVFGGCVWHYYGSFGDPNPLFDQIALSPEGTMTLPVRGLDKIGPLEGFFKEYVHDHNE